MARKTTSDAPRGTLRSSRNTTGLFRSALRFLVRGLLGGAILVVAVTLALRWLPAPTSAFILTRHVERLFENPPGPEIMQIWTPRAAIPRHVALAAVAAEDQNFFRHHGFDFKAISEAMRYNALHRKVRGASTISQQTAKNLFLWSGRSWMRKGLEAGLTVLIELLWPKERILEMYLNLAEFGDGTYGVGAAARRFFGTTPDRLSPAEAAQLVCVLPSPRRLSARNPQASVLQRAAWVRVQMRQLGANALLWP